MPDDKRPSHVPSFDDETVSRESERGRRLTEDARLARDFARFGSTDSIPWIMLSDAAVRARRLDTRATFVLSHVDGRRNVASLVDVCALPGAEVLAVLMELATKGVLALR
jgi:hypothetical protein